MSGLNSAVTQQLEMKARKRLRFDFGLQGSISLGVQRSKENRLTDKPTHSGCSSANRAGRLLIRGLVWLFQECLSSELSRNAGVAVCEWDWYLKSTLTPQTGVSPFIWFFQQTLNNFSRLWNKHCWSCNPLLLYLQSLHGAQPVY